MLNTTPNSLNALTANKVRWCERAARAADERERDVCLDLAGRYDRLIDLLERQSPAIHSTRST